MTIKQFQELYYIAQGEDVEFEKSIKMVAAMRGITPDKVEGMPMKRFNYLCHIIEKSFGVFNKKLLNGKPKKFIVVGWHIYRLNYEVSKLPMNAGKYIEALTFSKDVVNNLHKIMATIAIPVKLRWFKLVPFHVEHDAIATDMERANFEAAYHAAVFFYTQFQMSMQVIQPYLVKKAVRKGANRTQTETALTNLSNILDGSVMPKWSQNLKVYLSNRFLN